MSKGDPSEGSLLEGGVDGHAVGKGDLSKGGENGPNARGNGLGGLGEFGIIDLFRGGAGQVPSGLGIGDDCAVLDQGGPERILVTTDMLVEGVHFLRRAISPWRLGWKSVAVSVSDVAAMAGRPLAAFLSLGLPADYSRGDLEAFRDGVLACCRAYDVVLAGGDTVSSPRGLVVNVALVGAAPADQIRYRSGATPGQVVCTAAPLGASAAGLDYLLATPEVQARYRAALASTPAPDPLEVALTAHLEPRPQVALGRLLGQRPAVGALIDLSDGLVADLVHVARQSQVRIEVDSSRVPVATAALALGRAMGRPALPWGLFGGEEYCLLFTVAPAALPDIVQEAQAQLGVTITEVGRVEPGTPEVRVDGEAVSGPAGWDHFRSGVQGP